MECRDKVAVLWTPEAAGWAQAIGTILAILGAAWITRRRGPARGDWIKPELRVGEVEGLHPPAGKAAMDTWVADLLEKPENTRAASLYELLMRLNLNVSHLNEAREAYVRRLGVR